MPTQKWAVEPLPQPDEERAATLLESVSWARIYVGSREALIAAGLAREGQFPGLAQPSCSLLPGLDVRTIDLRPARHPGHPAQRPSGFLGAAVERGKGDRPLRARPEPLRAREYDAD